MKRLFEGSLPRFLLVGAGNTLLSALIMLLLEDLGYWPSSAVAYLAGGVMSFFLNRSFTFHAGGRMGREAARFAVNLAVCYFVAYGLARPAAFRVLGQLELSALWQERCAKLLGICLYTGLNYLGQRFFAFRKN